MPPNNVYDKAEDVKCSNYDSIKLMSKSEYFLFLLKPLCVLQGLFDPTFAKLKKNCPNGMRLCTPSRSTKKKKNWNDILIFMFVWIKTVALMVFEVSGLLMFLLHICVVLEDL